MRDDEPVAIELVIAVRDGDLEVLRRLLSDDPALARARIAGKRGGSRTALHVVTDWPGYFPDGPAIAQLLIDGGADLEVPNGSIGTPLDNAVGYGCWHVARLLAARGGEGR
jgi:hypothetical protein